MIQAHFGHASASFGASDASSFGPPSDERTIVVSEALTTAVGNRLVQQIALLDEPSEDPMQILMSNAPGGEEQVALSVYDAVRTAEAPVTMVGGGRIAGAGIYAFVGAASSRRVALPHVRFRFEPPTAPVSPRPANRTDQAEAEQEHRGRIVRLLAAATGQSEEQIQTDLSGQRAFDAEAAKAYGLIDRVVQSRRAVD